MRVATPSKRSRDEKGTGGTISDPRKLSLSVAVNPSTMDALGALVTNTDARVDSPEVLARIQDGLRLVPILARKLKRFAGSTLGVEDLVSYGNEALVRAARSFDPARGVPFDAWACLRIRGAMMDGIRAHGPLTRTAYRLLRAMEAADQVESALTEEIAMVSPTAPAEEFDALLGQTLTSLATAMSIGMLDGPTDVTPDAPTETLSPEEEVARGEVLEATRQAIAKLPAAERQLLERHYFDGLTLDEAARELGLSKSWGSRLHARAIEGITKSLRRNRSVP